MIIIIKNKKNKNNIVDSTSESSALDEQQICLKSSGQSVSKNPIRTFSNVDFTNCQCNLILNTVYSQMLDHCRGMKEKEKTLTTILEFVEILLAALNIPQARKLLKEAEDILATVSKRNRFFSN